MANGAPQAEAMLARAAAGDPAAWGKLVTAHQEKLSRMVAFRMDPRLRGRIDAADIVQDAFVDAHSSRDRLRDPFAYVRNAVVSRNARTARGDSTVIRSLARCWRLQGGRIAPRE